MAKVVIDKRGTKRYFDDDNHWHRDDGPAVIYTSGTRWWYSQSSPVRMEDTNGHIHIWGKEKTTARFPNGYIASVGLNSEIIWPEL